MLEFICGAESCGKSEIIYERARKDAESGRTVYILVPEQYSMYAEKEMISRMGLSAQDRIQILTFSRLCNMIFARKGPLRMKYADNAGKYMLMRKAINRAEKELTVLRSNARQHGFAKIAASMVSEFKRYGVTHDMLRETSEKLQNERLKAKLFDLTAIYERFDEIIEEGYSNAEDNLSLIVEKIADCEFISGVFYIDFFRSFTPTEYDVLSEIMKKADVCVSLCTDTVDEDSIVFSSQVYAYRKLRKIAERLNVEIGKTEFKDSDSLKPAREIAHLKKNYFLAIPNTFEEEISAVNIYRPDNFYAEVTDCAQLIVKLCREEGYELNDILVLTGSMENYVNLIPPIFEEFGIKYFLDRKAGLTESSLMRAIISVIEILAFGFSYERVMAIAKSGYFDCSKEDVDMFENYVLATGIGHRQWNSREEWEYNPDKKIFNIETVNGVRRMLVGAILDFKEMFAGRKTVLDICDRLGVWLEKQNLPQRVEEKVNKFTDCGQIEYAGKLRLTWNNFVSVLGQMSDCMGGDSVTFLEFYEIFTSACAELTVGIVPPTQDKVIISEAAHFRSTGNKAVIVLGVNDGVFPKSYLSEGLISDVERMELMDAGIELAPDAYNRQREEQFLIYSVFATAIERLYLFAPINDRDGKSLGVSEIIQRIKDKIFPSIGYMENSLFEGKEHIFNALLSEVLKCGCDLYRLEGIWKTAYSYFEGKEGFSEKLRNIEEMHKNKEHREQMSSEVAELLYGQPLVLSVSKLEKYNSCAFAFFMRYGLIANNRLTGSFEAKDMGTVIHAVLCDYFKDKKEKNIEYENISRNECECEISELVEKHTAEEKAHLGYCFHNYIKMRMKSIATATAWKLVRFYSQSELRPKAFEVGFGRKGELPPFKIETENGKVFLEGFVDRVDEMTINGKKYIAITDYKSSEKKLTADLAEAGVRFQPLIYANAICSSQDETYPAAMFYMHMNDPILRFDKTPTEDELEKKMFDGIKIQGVMLSDSDIAEKIEPEKESKKEPCFISCEKNSRLDEESMREWIKGAGEKARETAGKIVSGNIEIKPTIMSGFSACDYCEYKSICSDK